MSDNIQPIRFVPQISKLNPNRRTGDKKGNKESKNDFSKHVSDRDKGEDGKGDNQVKKDYENTEHKKQNDENSLQENIDNDFDSSCGTILDTEI